MATTDPLPSTHRALRQEVYAEPPKVTEVPTPQPTPGSAIIRVLTTNVVGYAKDIYNGTRQYPYPTPLTLGCSAIGRIAAVGPDAVSLKPGQLVLVDVMIRGRDSTEESILSGFFEGLSEGSKKLMADEWRDGSFAEYVKMPLENCFALDEKVLLDGGLGYSLEDLTVIPQLLVPYGGLKNVGITPGDTVLVAPATGGFGGAAVNVALAMGAGRVIAMGRNEEMLRKIASGNPRISTVKMVGDVKEEVAAITKLGPVDVFFDISPPQAAKSTHIKSGILSLRHGGKAGLMGGIMEDTVIPYGIVVHSDLTIKGKHMCERDDILTMLRMVHSGVMKLTEGQGMRCVGAFKLEEWEKAFDVAEKETGNGFVVLKP